MEICSSLKLTPGHMSRRTRCLAENPEGGTLQGRGLGWFGHLNGNFLEAECSVYWHYLQFLKSQYRFHRMIAAPSFLMGSANAHLCFCWFHLIPSCACWDVSAQHIQGCNPSLQYIIMFKSLLSFRGTPIIKILLKLPSDNTQQVSCSRDRYWVTKTENK